MLSRCVYVARALQIVGNRFAQRWDAARGAVTVAARCHSVAERIHYRRSGMKIRFAKLQMNDRTSLAFEFFGA